MYEVIRQRFTGNSTLQKTAGQHLTYTGSGDPWKVHNYLGRLLMKVRDGTDDLIELPEVGRQKQAESRREKRGAPDVRQIELTFSARDTQLWRFLHKLIETKNSERAENLFAAFANDQVANDSKSIEDDIKTARSIIDQLDVVELTSATFQALEMEAMKLGYQMSEKVAVRIVAAPPKVKTKINVIKPTDMALSADILTKKWSMPSGIPGTAAAATMFILAIAHHLYTLYLAKQPQYAPVVQNVIVGPDPFKFLEMLPSEYKTKFAAVIQAIAVLRTQGFDTNTFRRHAAEALAAKK